MLTFRELFGLPNRAVEGFVASLFEQMHVELEIPDHTTPQRVASTLSRRGQTLRVNLTRARTGRLQGAFDAGDRQQWAEGVWRR